VCFAVQVWLWYLLCNKEYAWGILLAYGICKAAVNELINLNHHCFVIQFQVTPVAVSGSQHQFLDSDSESVA